jgi:hypothetical protein
MGRPCATGRLLLDRRFLEQGQVRLMLLPSLPLGVSLLVFVGCAVAIWIAGIPAGQATECVGS